MEAVLECQETGWGIGAYGQFGNENFAVEISYDWAVGFEAKRGPTTIAESSVQIIGLSVLYPLHSNEEFTLSLRGGMGYVMTENVYIVGGELGEEEFRPMIGADVSVAGGRLSYAYIDGGDNITDTHNIRIGVDL